MPVDTLIADINPAAIVPDTTDNGQCNSLPFKRAIHCDSEDATPAAKRQRPVLVHRESTSSDISGSIHPEPVPEQIIPFSALALGTAIDDHIDQGSDTSTSALPNNVTEAKIQDEVTDQIPAHIELLEDYLAKLFQGENQISNHDNAKSEHFHQISHTHGDVLVLNKRAVRQLHSLLTPCSPEQLAKYVPDDEIGRVVCMLVAVVEAADGAGLADM
ncbi:hypothetical protein H4R27_006510, partial [Coemansia aciculifera]